ncbi:MAG: hypothetical protein E7478_10020, partial [Ruminococcaceae bacterium]|nr:hypothetical protein [Oscillospiraceae bacterium]
MKIKKLLKKALSVIAASAICICAAGCDNAMTGQDTTVNVAQPGAEAGGSVVRAYQPIKKADGSKFKLAYVDIDPYNE